MEKVQLPAIVNLNGADRGLMTFHIYSQPFLLAFLCWLGDPHGKANCAGDTGLHPCLPLVFFCNYIHTKLDTLFYKLLFTLWTADSFYFVFYLFNLGDTRFEFLSSWA